MPAMMDINPLLGSMPNSGLGTLSEKWGLFVVLGVADLILGGVASSNLTRVNLASVLFIGVALLISGLFQVVHAFSARRLCSFLLWLLGSLAYTAAGVLILYDAHLASLELSLLVGAFLVVAGIARASAGIDLQFAPGWPWIVVSGALTFSIGIAVIAVWPVVGLRLFAAMLAADLIVQGTSHIALAAALRKRAMRRPCHYVTV